MAADPNGQHPGACAAPESRARVVFIGSALSFSAQMLVALRSEFAELDFMRDAGLQAFRDTSSGQSNVALTVVDAMLVVDATESMDEILESNGESPLVIAYRDPAAALRLLAAQNGSGKLANLGFLPLDVHMEVWLAVMRLLLCGEVFYPRELMAAFRDMSDSDPVRTTHPAVYPHSRNDEGAEPRLTPRELEVLSLVARGKQNKLIAAHLNLSEHTVKLHMHHLMKKLGVANRTGASMWYLNNGQHSLEASLTKKPQ